MEVICTCHYMALVKTCDINIKKREWVINTIDYIEKKGKLNNIYMGTLNHRIPPISFLCIIS